MENKYRVPALERADVILQLVAANPSRMKLIDLSKTIGINKSSMFSLLKTMEALNWVVCDKDGTYALGSKFGSFGSAYFKQFDFFLWFHREASSTRDKLNETIQLAKLDRENIFYLSKVEANSPVRLISEPGMTLPAYATALGKVLLSQLPDSILDEMYPGETLQQLTPQTIGSKTLLKQELIDIRRNGYALDHQEAVIGFCCVAAPVFSSEGKMIYSVSASMPMHEWEVKRDLAKAEICDLAQRLSHLS